MEHLQKLKTIDGFSIAAIHTTSKRKSVILWLHGISENKDEYLNFFKDGAKYVADKGIDSLRIDFRGHGESGGTSLDFSIVGQMLDVEAALNYIEKKYSRQRKNIHIIGCSFGAPPAIFTAIRRPEIIKSVILIAPVLSYKRTFLNPKKQWAKSIFNKETLTAMDKSGQLLISENFPISIRLVEEMRIIRPDLALQEITRNVIIIHGDADSMVPYIVSRDIAVNMPKIRFISIPKMDHGFMDLNDEEGTSGKSIENKKRIYEIIAQECI